MTGPSWFRRSTVLRSALLLAVLVAAGFVLTPKVEEASGDLHRLQGGSNAWLLLALAAELASLVAFSVVTRWLVQPRDRPPFRRVLRIDLVTIALSHAVPAGAAAGTLVGYEMLEEEGVGRVEAGFVKVSQSLLSQLLLQLLLALALALQLVFYAASPPALGLTAAGSVMFVLVGVFAWLLGRHPGVIARIARRTLGWIPKLTHDRLDRGVDELAARVQDLLAHPRLLAWICLWSMGNWIFDLASLWASMRVFGHPPNLVLLTVAFAAAQVLASIPISPAGLGIVEGSLVALLTGFGTPTSVAVLGTLTWRLFNYFLPLPIGAVAYAAIRVDRRRGLLPRGG